MKIINKIVGGSIGIAAALVLSASIAQGQNLLVDPNFSGAFVSNPISPTSGGENNGWALYGGSASTNMFSSPDYPYNYPANNSALLTQNTTWGGEGAYQILTAPIVLGGTYTFSMYALSDNGVSSYATPLALDLNFVGPWNGSSYPSLTNGADGGAITYSANDNGFVNTPGQNVWTQFSVTIKTTSGAGIYGIVVQPQTINGGTPPMGQAAQNIYFDDATLTVTPEPTTLALVGMGLAAIPFYFRRRNV